MHVVEPESGDYLLKFASREIDPPISPAPTPVPRAEPISRLRGRNAGCEIDSFLRNHDNF